jgi:adenosyl cobinamide kinase/adenosyl cobinamide phosphate guanylyltransferase
MLQPETLAGHGAVVLDRFTIWLSNRLTASEATADYDLVAEVEALSDKLYRSTTPIVVVTTEIGLGFLPPASPTAA